MYDLYIANKNYSSWSLRPWALMRDALKETLRDKPHDEEIARVGRVVEDLRAT
jgi:hypothetical protein